MRGYSFAAMSVCPDCLMAAANGVESVEGAGVEWAAAWAAAVEREGVELVAACTDPEHVDPVTGESCYSVSFSWRECDWCRVPLGGDRYCAAVALPDPPAGHPGR